MLNQLTVVFPTVRCPEFTKIVIKSFEKFKYNNLSISYIVVENSDDNSAMKDICSLARDVKYINNKLDTSGFPISAFGSFSNAAGVIAGLKLVETEWVFIAHSDVCVVSHSFFEELRECASNGFELIGTVRDNTRAKAIHVSGYLTKTALARKINFYPTMEQNCALHSAKVLLDVGDELDVLCRKENRKTFCYKNTENGFLCTDEHFRSFAVDRCMDSSGNVMFLHLGRGTPKMMGTYNKSGRVTADEWISFCTRLIK
jgi:hypothetical protein